MPEPATATGDAPRWTSPGGTFVCSECVADARLQDAVYANLGNGKCDYCRRYECTPISALTDSVFEAAARLIHAGEAKEELANGFANPLLRAEFERCFAPLNSS